MRIRRRRTDVGVRDRRPATSLPLGGTRRTPEAFIEFEFGPNDTVSPRSKVSQPPVRTQTDPSYAHDLRRDSERRTRREVSLLCELTEWPRAVRNNNSNSS